MIKSVNGEEVKDSRDLAKKIAAMAPDTPVKLDLLHNGSQKTVSLTVAKMPSESLTQIERTGGSP